MKNLWGGSVIEWPWIHFPLFQSWKKDWKGFQVGCICHSERTLCWTAPSSQWSTVCPCAWCAKLERLFTVRLIIMVISVSTCFTLYWPADSLIAHQNKSQTSQQPLFVTRCSKVAAWIAFCALKSNRKRLQPGPALVLIYQPDLYIVWNSWYYCWAPFTLKNRATANLFSEKLFSLYSLTINNEFIISAGHCRP